MSAYIALDHSLEKSMWCGMCAKAEMTFLTSCAYDTFEHRTFNIHHFQFFINIQHSTFVKSEFNSLFLHKSTKMLVVQCTRMPTSNWLYHRVHHTCTLRMYSIDSNKSTHEWYIIQCVYRYTTKDIFQIACVCSTFYTMREKRRFKYHNGFQIIENADATWYSYWIYSSNEVH